MQLHTAASSSFTSVFTLIGNCRAEQIICLMTYNICYPEGTLLLTMTVKPTCNALFTVGSSYMATYRETWSQFTLMCVYIRLRPGQYLMFCLLSQWGVLSFANIPLMEVNMVPWQRQAAVCLSGREVDSQHAPPTKHQETRNKKKHRWCRKDRMSYIYCYSLKCVHLPWKFSCCIVFQL